MMNFFFIFLNKIRINQFVRISQKLILLITISLFLFHLICILSIIMIRVEISGDLPLNLTEDLKKNQNFK